MTDEWVTRIYDLVMLTAGAIVGAWIYHRGLRQQSPMPSMLDRSRVIKPKEQPKPELPEVGV